MATTKISTVALYRERLLDELVSLGEAARSLGDESVLEGVAAVARAVADCFQCESMDGRAALAMQRTADEARERGELERARQLSARAAVLWEEGLAS